jgi:hypothetical protein
MPRTAAVTQVFRMLIQTDITMACPGTSKFKFSPLPSRKSLWAATNEVEWGIEYAMSSSRPGMYAILKNGDLVEITRSDEDLQMHIKDWDDWYAGSDELGILIMTILNLA